MSTAPYHGKLLLMKNMQFIKPSQICETEGHEEGARGQRKLPRQPKEGYYRQMGDQRQKRSALLILYFQLNLTRQEWYHAF